MTKKQKPLQKSRAGKKKPAADNKPGGDKGTESERPLNDSQDESLEIETSTGTEGKLEVEATGSAKKASRKDKELTERRKKKLDPASDSPTKKGKVSKKTDERLKSKKQGKVVKSSRKKEKEQKQGNKNKEAFEQSQHVQSSGNEASPSSLAPILQSSGCTTIRSDKPKLRLEYYILDTVRLIRSCSCDHHKHVLNRQLVASLEVYQGSVELIQEAYLDQILSHDPTLVTQVSRIIVQQVIAYSKKQILKHLRASPRHELDILHEDPAESRYDSNMNVLTTRLNIFGERYASMWDPTSYIGARGREEIYQYVKHYLQDEFIRREQKRIAKLNKQGRQPDETRRRKTMSLREKQAYYQLQRDTKKQRRQVEVHLDTTLGECSSDDDSQDSDF